MELFILIASLSSYGFLWVNSTPTIMLRVYLKNKIKWTNPLIDEFLTCVLCTSFWIGLVGTFILTSSIICAILFAPIISIVGGLIDGYWKVRL
jgi:hypothetical protein